jgi:hypothetical protein
MGAAALVQREGQNEAKSALAKLLELEGEFPTKARRLISRYVKVDALVDNIIEGLRKSGPLDIA